MTTTARDFIISDTLEVLETMRETFGLEQLRDGFRVYADAGTWEGPSVRLTIELGPTVHLTLLAADGKVVGRSTYTGAFAQAEYLATMIDTALEMED